MLLCQVIWPYLYRFLWICLLFSGALARASGIKIAVIVAERNISTAKYIAKVVWIILTNISFNILFVARHVSCCGGATSPVCGSLLFSLLHGENIFKGWRLCRWSCWGQHSSGLPDDHNESNSGFRGNRQFNSMYLVSTRSCKAIVRIIWRCVYQAIVSSLGKTRHLLVSGLLGSWVGQVPACFICSMFWRNDIIGKAHILRIQHNDKAWRFVLGDVCWLWPPRSVPLPVSHTRHWLGTMCGGGEDAKQERRINCRWWGIF